jgi:RNA polymerase sigma-70 factor (ECF subfamily)
LARPDRLRARDDTALAGLAAGGDRDALEILLERHVDRVHAICRRVLGNPEDALDATQEALLAVVRAISRFETRAAFTTWLHRVATNAAIDELRRRNRRAVPDAALVERAERVGSGAPAESDAVAARFDVDAALSRIPDEFRVAVVLRDLADLDYAQIASVLDVPVGTVRSRIARGRAALARELGGSRAGNPTPPAERPTEYRP